MRIVGAACLGTSGALALLVSIPLAAALLVLSLWHACVILADLSWQRRSQEIIWAAGSWSPDPLMTMATVEQVLALPYRKRRRVLRAVKRDSVPPVVLSAQSATALRQAMSAQVVPS